MFHISRQVLEELLAPVLAAQILLFVLAYFTLVKKRIASNYKLYVCFLVAFIVFLVTRPLQLHLRSGNAEFTLLYFRMALLFGVVFPSLTLAVLGHSGIPRNRRLFVGAFAGGFLFACAYIFLMAAWRGDFGLNRGSFEWLLPEGVDYSDLAQFVPVAAAFVYWIFPCVFLLHRELRSGRRWSLYIFLTSALIFGILMALGNIWRYYGLYYAGSVVFAACWAWVIYKDINDLKGRVSLLNEELQYLVQSGPDSIAPEIEHLLADLEALSFGNMAVYKMRIRTILSMLADVTIQAGGDSGQLASRNEMLIAEIDLMSDPDAMRQLLRSEAVELSGMIASMPAKQMNVVAERAKRHIEEKYEEDLSVDSIADALQMSRSHLMHEFKKGAGQTVNQYLNHFRIEQAKQLLAEKTVTETAFAVGFNSSNYFGTVFKKLTGMSPLEFQESLKSQK